MMCMLSCFGSSVHGVLQARILEWVAIPSSGDLPDPGIKPTSLSSPVLAGGFVPLGGYKGWYCCAGEVGRWQWARKKTSLTRNQTRVTAVRVPNPNPNPPSNIYTKLKVQNKKKKENFGLV